MGKGISTGAEVAFRRIKVTSAATASETIEFLLGTDPKKHPLARIAVSIIKGLVTNGITNGE
jgi:hypothetical protein